MNILTQIISTPKARILCIGGLLEDATDIRLLHGGWTYDITDKDILVWIEPNKYPQSVYIDPIPGNWQHLGPLSDIPEDVAEKIVGRYFNNYKPQQKLNQQSQYDMFWVKYPDGTNKHFNTKHECYSHALKMELFHIIETNVKLVNKYGANTPKSDMFGSFSRFKEAFEEWQAEESQVFHNPVLFVEYK